MKSNEESSNQQHCVNLSVNKPVFLIPWLFLIGVMIVSLVNGEAFLKGLDLVTDWILSNFAWAFNSTALACVFVVIFVYFSPLAKVKIGGNKAKPMMKFSSLIWITLCTTIAAGILFWACAEPIYQMYAPAISENVEPGSRAAALFAMKTMFLEWTWSPYAIYTVATLIFSFVFYNMRQPFSIGSALVPVFGEKAKKYNSLVDIACLFALVAGMSASLGTGTMTIAGGIERMFGIKSSPLPWGIIILVIVITFVASSVSGIMKGIKKLSDINAKVYMFLLAFLLIFGPTAFMLNFTIESLGAYIRDFIPLSLNTGQIFQDSWAKSWPIFYWCNWLAWTPTTAVFLGRLLKGYTIKDAIKVNFILPAIFSTIWMGIFSTATIFYELNGVSMLEILNTRGPEAVVYALFDQLPLSIVFVN